MDGGHQTLGELAETEQREPSAGTQAEPAIIRYARALATAAPLLTSLLDLRSVLHMGVDILAQDFDAALARVWFYESEGNTLSLQARAGAASDPPSVLADHFPSEVAREWRSHIGQTGAYAVIRNPGPADGFDEAWIARESIATVVAIPLVGHGNSHGVLMYYSCHALPPAAIDVVYALSAIVSTSLRDVQRFTNEREGRALAEAATARLQTAQAVVDEALVDRPADVSIRAILEVIRDSLHADAAAMLLIEEGTNALQVVSSIGLEDEATDEVRIPVGKGFSGTSPPVVSRGLLAIRHRSTQ